MQIATIILFNAEDAEDTPDVFAGISSADCVNQVKQHMVDANELGIDEEDRKSRSAFNKAVTFDELREWFRWHYCSYDIKETIINVNEAGHSKPVKMLPLD